MITYAILASHEDVRPGAWFVGAGWELLTTDSLDEARAFFDAYDVRAAWEREVETGGRAARARHEDWFVQLVQDDGENENNDPILAEKAWGASYVNA